MKRCLSLILLSAIISSCGAKVYNRGITIPPSKLESIQTGADIEAVRKEIGSPSWQALFNEEETWFYLSFVKEQTMFFTPEQKDTKLYSFTFDKKGKLLEQKEMELSPQNIKVARETTPIPGSREEGWLKSLFSNIGRFNIPTNITE